MGKGRKGNRMKKLVVALFATGALTAASFAGTDMYSGKEMKQVAPVPPPCPQWFADNEWDISLWGAYAFSATEDNRSSIENADDFKIYGTYDRFLADDHAWGGGIDAKYFFRRYFGVGVEGFGLTGHSTHGVFDHPPDNAVEEFYQNNDHATGGALGTITLRYPISCTRFAPYVWAGGGFLFGGRNDRPAVAIVPNGTHFTYMNNEAESRGVGQFGGGMEVRITPHIGWISDFSWNVVDGPHNNFGMARTGINFAF
jgi:hypothetical protein